MVVDGCGVDGAGCAQRLLDRYGARPEMVVFSHPHLDHARGLAEVVEQATRGSEAQWPDFSRGGGLDRLLQRQSPISLTGLPRRHAAQAGEPWLTTRGDLEAAPHIELDPPARGFPDCFVMVTLSRDGPPILHHGPGSVCLSN